MGLPSPTSPTNRCRVPRAALVGSYRVGNPKVGGDVRQTYLWGRPQTVAGSKSERAIEVGPLPTLVTGLDRGVAVSRAGFVFERDRLPVSPINRTKNRFEVANRFERGIEGSVDRNPGKEPPKGRTTNNALLAARYSIPWTDCRSPPRSSVVALGSPGYTLWP